MKQKHLLLLLIGIVGLGFLYMVMQKNAENKALEEKVVQSFNELHTKDYFAQLRKLSRESEAGLKSIQKRHLDPYSYHTRLLENIQSIQSNAESAELLYVFLAESGDQYKTTSNDIELYLSLIKDISLPSVSDSLSKVLKVSNYQVTKDDLKLYIESVGDKALLDMVDENLFSQELITEMLKDTPTVYADGNKYPAFLDLYTRTYKYLKAQLDKVSYGRVEGAVIGRIRVQRRGTDRQRAALVKTFDGKTVAVLYIEMYPQQFMYIAQQSEDTYAEQQKAYQDMMSAYSYSPQNSQHFNGATVSTGEVITTNNHEYEAYQYCTKFNMDECRWYKRAGSPWSKYESSTSKDAQSKIESLKPLLTQFNIL